MEQAEKKALVVEDDPLNRDMVSTVLEDRGYIVYSANDGDIGLELLKKEGGVDIVITDIFMPNKEGIGFIRAMRSLYPDTKIVAITGAMNFESISSTALEFGAHVTFKKPFDIDEFADKVDQLITA